MRSGFWRKCRVCFRWCRIVVWLTLLVLLCILIRFNRVGLPDFLKTRLVATLHARGIELEFTRLRLHLRGLVAENVRVGGGNARLPTLTLAEVQLRPDFNALRRFQFQIDGLALHQGKLVWAVTPTNMLTVDHIETDLRFQTNDTWSLDNFKADFSGAKISLSGDIAHAPEFRNWEVFRASKTGGPADWTGQLKKLQDTLDGIHFEGQPQLSLSVNGDARDIHSFIVRLNLNAPAAQTPWFNARNIQLTTRLKAPDDAPADVDPAWGFWTNAQPYRLEWSARFKQLRSEKLNADSIVCAGLWRAPEVVVTNVFVELGGGQLRARAKLNVATRELAFTNSSCFDLHAIDGLLPEKIRRQFVDSFRSQPPSLQVGGSLVLPAWTNPEPDWDGEVRPTVRLNGELALTNGMVMGAKIDLAHTHFSYSNLVWNLPDLAIAQAHTRLEFDGEADDATKNFHGHIAGAFDPEAIVPFLTTSNAVRGLHHFTPAGPVALDLNARGNLRDLNRIAAAGSVALTNFAVRGQAMDSVAGTVNYSNGVLDIFNPLLLRAKGTQTMTGDRLTLDFNARLISFTNGLSTVEPMAFVQCIGAKTAKLLEPYLRFSKPPTVRVNGWLPLRDINNVRDLIGTDIRFDVVKGAEYQWLKLKTPSITGTVRWFGEQLLLTNLDTTFYEGRGNGFAYFDFSPPHPGADYRFAFEITNANLRLLAADMAAFTNQIDGTLAGQLVVTNASTENLQSWNGFGHVELRDGLLWDVPVFGIFSSALNTISPGLGDSRATDATAQFTITNGVIFTDSLEIHSTMTRLQYVGTVDFQKNVNARVNAKLLRDTWVVGPLISSVLWPMSKIFEYQVSGTLQNPKKEPVYVPNIFHPIRAVEEMFPGSDVAPSPPPPEK